MKNNKEFKVFMSPNWRAGDEYHIAKMPDSFKASQNNLHLEKKAKSYEIEDQQKFKPELYEGFLENQKIEGCKYLAFIKGKDDFRVVPISHWVLFHKKLRLGNEEEYNLKFAKIEEEMTLKTKGERSLKRLITKKRNEKELEEEDLREEREKKEQEEKEEIFIKKNTLKRKRKESMELSEDEEEENLFFKENIVDSFNPIPEKSIKKNETDQPRQDLLSAMNEDDDNQPMTLNSEGSDKSIDKDFPELI